jgi:hypothetical protein
MAGPFRGAALERPRAPAPAPTPGLPHPTPRAIDEAAFKTFFYQHMATLTSNGRNLPFVLPLKVDRLPCGGFQARRGRGAAWPRGGAPGRSLPCQPPIRCGDCGSQGRAQHIAHLHPLAAPRPMRDPPPGWPAAARQGRRLCVRRRHHRHRRKRGRRE